MMVAVSRDFRDERVMVPPMGHEMMGKYVHKQMTMTQYKHCNGGICKCNENIAYGGILLG